MRFLLLTSFILVLFASNHRAKAICNPKLQSVSGVDSIEIVKNKFNWLNFPYDDVRVYLYGLQPNSYMLPEEIITGDSLNPSVLNKEGIQLTSDQIARVNEILSGKFFSKEDRLAASCFLPHHGIVFYHEGKVVGHISICLMCTRLKAYPHVGYFDYEQLSALMKEIHLPTFKNVDEVDAYWKANYGKDIEKK